MTSAPDADVAALADVTADLVATLDSIEDDQWTIATPCADWDLAALVDHVTGGNWFTIGVLAGQTSNDAMAATLARFDRGSAGAATAARSAKDQLDAFAQDGALEQTWHHVAGRLAGRQILRLRVHDLIVHTWDLGEALHPPASVRRHLAEWGVDELLLASSLMAKHFQIPGAPGFPSRDDDAPSAYLRAFGR